MCEPRVAEGVEIEAGAAGHGADAGGAAAASDVFGTCYLDKCVWGARVVGLPLVAVRLAQRDYFSLRALREHGVSVGSGPRAALQVRRVLLAYASARYRGLPHEEAVELAARRFGLRVAGYLAEMAKYVVDNSASVVRNRAQRLPPTGWAWFEEAERVTFISPTYVWRYISDARVGTTPASVRLAFCDDHTCYPTCCGLWPGLSWVAALRGSLRNEILYQVEEEFGALTVRDYLDYVADPSEYAVNYVPSGRAPKVVLFARVADPRRHVIQVSKLQLRAREALGLGIGIKEEEE